MNSFFEIDESLSYMNQICFVEIERDFFFTLRTTLIKFDTVIIYNIMFVNCPTDY